MKKSLILCLSLFASSFAIGQFNGELDSTFGKNGVVVHDYNQQEDVISKAIFASNGKIYLGGYTFDNNDPNMLIMSLNADGSLNTSFGNNGAREIDYANGERDYLRDMVELSNGNILAVGSHGDFASSDRLIAVYKPDGSHDGTFNQSGYIIEGGNYSDGLTSCMALSNGNMLVAGYSSDAAGSDVLLAVYKPDGTLDNNFGFNGKLSMDYATNERITAIITASPTKFYAVSREDSKNLRVVCFDDQGNAINSFGSSGTKTIKFPNVVSLEASKLLLDSQGDIYIIGHTYYSPGTTDKALVIKLNSNGDLDSSYAVNGIFEATVGGGQSNLATDALFLNDGNLLIAGAIVKAGELLPMNFKLATDGTLIFNHGVQGVYSYKVSNQTNSYNAKLVQDNSGDIYSYVPLRFSNQFDFCLLKHKSGQPPLNLKEHSNRQHITAYPNPNSGECQLDLSAFETEVTDIQVFNMNGQVVMQLINPEPNQTIDLHSLPVGLYLLQARSKHQSAQIKIKKQ